MLTEKEKRRIETKIETKTKTVLDYLIEIGQIKDWRYSTSEEDNGGVDFVVTLNGGQQCFIDVKAGELTKYGAPPNRRFFSGERYGLLIFYYCPYISKGSDGVAEEAQKLMMGILSHIGELRRRGHKRRTPKIRF